MAEDNDLNMKLVNELLEGAGYALTKTALGQEAVKIAHETTPDLILLDIQLPDLSGFEVAARLKADPATRAVPIFAVSAFAEPEHEQKALESGCDAYMSKPIRVVDFLLKVKDFLA